MENKNNSNDQSTEKTNNFSGLLIGIGKKLLVLIVIGLAIQFTLPQITSFQKNIMVIRSIKTWILGLAIIAQFCSYVGNGITIRELVKSAHRQFSILRGVMISLASTSIGMVAGGMFGAGAATFRWVKAYGGGNEGASLSASLPPILIDVVLLGISLIGVVNLFFTKNLTRWQASAFIFISILLIALFTFFYYALRNREKSKGIAYKVVSVGFKLFRKRVDQGRINREFDRLFKAWDSLLAGGWKGPFLGSAINIIFDMITIYFVFLGTGKAIPLSILITGYGLPILLGKMAFIIPGGIGVIETTMVALYSSLGIPSAQATVVVLVYRIISFWTPLLLGYGLIPFLSGFSKNHGTEKN
ncbi:MAG: lysylphosphatidylglycerol synthase transmembrane domain-containing protein [Pelolinea sp.]|nr:lysylphosphatidylglycerol synthase transmembrane domain-containing protein [Pelolinea sp.]